MRQLEIMLKIRNMDEMMSNLKDICSNFGKSIFKRNHIDVYFHTNLSEGLVLRKYEDNTGELIIFEQKYVNDIIDRWYEYMGLPIPMAEEFLNILSLANGHKITISVKRCTYLHFLDIFSVMIDKVEDLGNFAIIQFSGDMFSNCIRNTLQNLSMKSVSTFNQPTV
ncbi:uncharacterized protein LOC116843904 isoform X2 [Odontomachus brunneus]|uniref:uncharacterized protein LOC116843904 isoform X2 n=1 Tax=Odontomachus brunneus TaxID=486640 RepID=UPI0013F22E38|nr:uncharacterized protein LOC116843904 isoform X2 [Odontomachus brunneus]